MTTPLLCLLGFAGWAILLVLALGVVRVSQVLSGKKKANEFPSGTPHGSDREWRLNRAHMNTLENLPIFATIVLVGGVAGATSGRLDLLAEIVLAGRIGQSLTHIAAGSNLAVNVRFSFFGAQLVAWILMARETLALASA